jgi:TP901 family phage tail tape measure protein
MAAAGTAAGKMSVDFDTAMRKIISLVGESEEQVARYSEAVLNLAGPVAAAPVELADALFFITSAGQKGELALSTLEAGAQAAAAGLGDTAVVVDAVTSAVNAYGAANLSSSLATATLVAAVREGKASAESLAPVFGDLLDNANLLNVQFHELGAGLAHITRTGKTASGAATQIGAIMLGIVKPTQQAHEQLAAVGSSMEEIRKEIRTRGLLSGLLKLRNTFGENTEALGRVFRNAEAFNGVLALTRNNGEDAAKIFESLAKTTEQDLADAFQAAAAGPGFALKQALTEIQVAAIRLGDALLPTVIPIIRQLTEIVGELADAFATLPEWARKAALVFGLVVAAAGPVLLVIGAIATGLATIGTATAGWAIAATVAAGIIATNWETIKKAVVRVLEFLQPAIDAVTVFIIDQWEKVRETAARVWPKVQQLVGRVAAKLAAFWEEHGEKVVRFVRTAWKIIGGIIETGVDLILGLVEGMIDVLNGDWDALKETAIRTFNAMMDGAGRIVAAGVAGIAAGFRRLAADVLTSIQSMLGKMRDWAAVVAAVAFFDPAAKKAAEAALGLIDKGYSAIGDQITRNLDEARKWEAAQAALLAPVDAAKEGLVEYRSEWVTATGQIEEAAVTAQTVFGNATDAMVGQLTGGFGKAADSMKAQYRDVAVTIEGTEITGTVKLKVDDEDFNRWLEERGLEPDTGGTVP